MASPSPKLSPAARGRADAAAQRKRDRESTRALRRAVTDGARAAKKLAKTLGATSRRQAGQRRRSAGTGRSGRPRAAPAVLMKAHRGGLSADRYSACKGQLIDTNLPAEAAARMTAWNRDQARHPRVSRLFVHLSFSRPPGQPLSDSQWCRFLAAWLVEAGFSGCKFAAWRHTDTANDHIHLLVSRARPEGGLVSDSQNFWTWRAATRAAEIAAGIPQPAPSTPAQRPSDRAVSARRRAKRRRQADPWIDPVAVRAALARSRSPTELQAHLANVGIELQLRLDAHGKPSGLLLRRQGAEEWLAGSSVARDLSLPQVQASLTQNARRSQLRPAPPLPGDGQAPTYPRERGG